MEALTKALKHFLGADVPVHKNLWACENLDESIYELRMLENAPGCIFSDICSFIDGRFRSCLSQRAPEFDSDCLANMFLRDRGRGLVSRKAWCVIHKRFCEAEATKVHVSGSPCVAWSNMGMRTFACHSSSALAFFVWVQLMRLLMVPFIVHENVPPFAIELFSRYLTDYHVHSCVVCPTSMGQVTHRPRRYTVLYHRSQNLVVQPWGPSFAALFERERRFTWRQLFDTVASEMELQAEAVWASRRRGTDESHEDDIEDKMTNRFDKALLAGGFRSLLSTTERMFWRATRIWVSKAFSLCTRTDMFLLWPMLAACLSHGLRGALESVKSVSLVVASIERDRIQENGQQRTPTKTPCTRRPRSASRPGHLSSGGG